MKEVLNSVHYNRILGKLVIDAIDCFLLSALIGIFLAPKIKKYIYSNSNSEKELKEMELLKASLIEKSTLLNNYRPVFRSKRKKIKKRIKKIFKFALENRGGQLEGYEASNKIYNLAHEIKELVEKLATFLKRREMRGIAKIFFKNGRLILELILYTCRVDMTYALLNEGMTTEVIVISTTTGGAAGFIVSWFSAGATLVFTPILISTLMIRSIAGQIVDLRNYSKFKKLLNHLLENDEELKKTILASFVDTELPQTNILEMKPWNLDENPMSEFKFTFDSDQTLEKFIKTQMKEQLGLLENPSSDQITEIINIRKNSRKFKSKTVYFRDFIKEINKGRDEFLETEIIKEAIRFKLKNEEL